MRNGYNDHKIIIFLIVMRSLLNCIAYAFACYNGKIHINNIDNRINVNKQIQEVRKHFFSEIFNIAPKRHSQEHGILSGLKANRQCKTNTCITERHY